MRGMIRLLLTTVVCDGKGDRIGQSPTPPPSQGGEHITPPLGKGGLGGVGSQPTVSADAVVPQPISAGERFAAELPRSGGQCPPPLPPLPKGGSYEVPPLSKGVTSSDGVRSPNANGSTLTPMALGGVSELGQRCVCVCLAPRPRRLLAPLLLFGLVTGCGVSSHNNGGSAVAPENAIERTAENGPVKLSVRVSPREPRLSDQLQMDVVVKSPPGVEIKPPAFGQAVGDFLVRDYSERAPEKGTKGQRRFHYELEPTHAGKHLIRSVAIEFVDKRPGSERKGHAALVESDPLEVNVTSELGNAVPSLANLQPMAPPQAVSNTMTLVWVAAVATIALLAIVGYIVRRRRKRPQAEPRRLTPEEVAHAALAALLAEDLPAQGLIKEFYVRLTGIVRRYVEDTTGIRAPEQTTEEFLRDIRSRAVFAPDRSVRLADFLESADLVKYAGQTPERGQIDQAIARAQEFVNLTTTPAGALAN